MIQKEVKKQLIDEYKTHEGDTGSPEVQIATTLPRRISTVTVPSSKSSESESNSFGIKANLLCACSPYLLFLAYGESRKNVVKKRRTHNRLAFRCVRKQAAFGYI